MADTGTERNNFLERLRAADEDVKRWWIAGGTIVLMTLIVTVWLTFFFTSPAPAAVPAEQLAQISAPDAESGFSLWETIRQGVGSMIRGLGGVLQEPRNYIVKPPQ